jgi:TRAP-type C4-dicarboxylate transport system permease small subunit
MHLSGHHDAGHRGEHPGKTGFRSALNGVYEIVRYLCLVIVVFAIPYAELDNAMVAVTFLEEWVKPKISNVIRVFWDFVGTIFFGFISYSYVLDAKSKYLGNAESSTLQHPNMDTYGVPVDMLLHVGARHADKGHLRHTKP